MGKTRRYDIITTPAERIEMAPLNEENEDEEDSTLFDIKYRCATRFSLHQAADGLVIANAKVHCAVSFHKCITAQMIFSHVVIFPRRHYSSFPSLFLNMGENSKCAFR